MKSVVLASTLIMWWFFHVDWLVSYLRHIAFAPWFQWDSCINKKIKHTHMHAHRYACRTSHILYACWTSHQLHGALTNAIHFKKNVYYTDVNESTWRYEVSTTPACMSTDTHRICSSLVCRVCSVQPVRQGCVFQEWWWSWRLLGISALLMVRARQHNFRYKAL